MRPTDDDAEILAIAKAGFMEEARELLLQFEQSLLALEVDPSDAEHLNAAFRAAHTIKGTAGLFGYDTVVSFTHEVETLLDTLRAGQRTLTEPIAAALLAGLDQMRALLDDLRDDDPAPQLSEAGQALAEQLRQLYGGAEGARGEAPDDDPSPAPATPAAAEADTPPTWHLSLRFSADALRHGLDPLAFLRYLDRLGQVLGVHTLTPAVPALAAMDPEACHLGFELRLRTPADRAAIESVFEFAQDECSLHILGPDATAADWAQMLQTRLEEAGPGALALQAVWDAWGLPPEPTADAHDTTLAPSEAAESEAPAAAEALPAAAVEERRATGDRRSAVRADEARFIRIRADKLDHLIDLIGELVIAGSGAHMVANREGLPSFLEATQRVTDLVQATRDGALALRMVPVGETFSRFQRVVRDISKQLGKQIELVITGGDTELDKSMVELIGDPLMHLVRNSLDHGIESPAERAAAGKSTTGRIGLNAYHEGGSIVIEVSDDGRGLSRERILRKAIERGLVQAAAAETLSDNEVWDIIFSAGFSTAETVTDLSGRGVGMDVVRRNIEQLRGQISLVSHEGRGTTTLVRLPLTLAMIDGFLTLVGGVHYVLPLSVVSECIDVPPECRQAPGRTCGTFDLRGEVLPYIDLALFYGMQADASARRSLVVVQQGTVRIGLVVDRLLGEHQTVIKPLASIFKPLEALAGSTILGSGDVALVMDLQGLVNAATRASGRGLVSSRG
ncbi:MAG: chemotaxis protein CheA [Rubrivivax sp.]